MVKIPKLKKIMNRFLEQFLRFITVGLITTTISYGVFLAALKLFFINYLISSCISFLSGVFLGYFFNKRWTFDSKKSESKKVILNYFLVYFLSLFISLIFLKISVDFFKIIPELAYIISIGITTCTNFIGIKFFVFRK